MKEISKFTDCRKELNNISTISEIKEVLKVYGRIINGKMYKYMSFNDYTIGFTDDTIYILKGKELLGISTEESGKLPATTVNYILDTILRLDTDEFYKFYFRKYGYESIIEDCQSTVVKNILLQFSTSKCRIKNIFVSEDYTSMTISGVKRNGTDYECNIMCCDKADVIELIELTRIKPYVNKRKVFDSYDRPYKPYFGASDTMIKDAYKEYKDYCSCDDESYRSPHIVDDYIKDEDEEEDYYEEE